MLNKLLNFHKLKRFSFIASLRPILAPPPEESMLALKIVHAGGFVESYYMAIPAAKVMEKYPSFLLTKPDIFKRPWDSVVHPDKILTPGEKYYIVPRGTVKKLRRQIRKPHKEMCDNNPFESKNSNKDGSTEKLSRKKSEMCEKNNSSCVGGRMKNAAKKRVTFSGIDVKHKACLKGSNPESHEGKRRVRNYVSWEPSLTSINESLDNDK